MESVCISGTRELVYVLQGEALPANIAHRVSNIAHRVASRTPLDCPMPYPARACIVDSICGRFVSPFCDQRHAGVSFKGNTFFGRHFEMYHVDGLLYCFGRTVHFKGCQGMAAVERIHRSILLPSSGCLVHMGIFSGSLGKRVFTDLGCYLENRVSERYDSIRVVGRMYDNNIMIRLHIADLSHPELPPLEASIRPTAADIVISGMGAVLLRFSWRSAAWSHALEARMLAYCDWLVSQLRGCC